MFFAHSWVAPGLVEPALSPLPNPLSIFLLVVDSPLEKAIGLAAAYPYRPTGYDECSVSANLLKSLNIAPGLGQRIRVTFNLNQFMTVCIIQLMRETDF